MTNEFSRTELLIGTNGMQKLQKATVMVLGVGGVGSHCIEALARSGIGRLILVDNDRVSLTNINRQSIAYQSTVGEYKTKLMKDRIRDINPAADVITYETFLLPENIHEIFEHKTLEHEIQEHEIQGHKIQEHEIQEHEIQGHEIQGYEIQGHEIQEHEIQEHEIQGHEIQGHEMLEHGIFEIERSSIAIDYIVDAIDTVTTKLAVVQYAKEKEIPVISCMGTGNKLHPELFEITDLSKTSVCPLCKVMRKELKNRGIHHLKVLYSKEKPIDTAKMDTGEEKGRRRSLPGSISFVPPVAGLMIAGEVIRQIAEVD